ncbi:MAG: DNA translocase FtsK [Prevotella sp.]|jgi:S-DNA-T family DNA segregation ATPase FtsK/SpoIIIE|nr:DNA translocase FtsK [Prevotella sp.]MCI2079920.1 DNA translocase FtsK [Prevotella sp.]MCI2101764.1 DNA translocase FtsK [Prevotella sp.]
MARKKSERKSQKTSKAVGYREEKKSEKPDFILGLILLSVAIYMIIAMISYFNTGQADQSTLESMRPGEWVNNGKQFTNYCGSFGAILAYYLITVNFGLPAFMIPAFFILVGLKLMKAYTINLWKWFLGMTVVMIWSSVTFAKFLTPIMGDQVFNPGGNHGLFCVQHLENMIGPPGLTAVLLITAIVFLTVLSTETITVIRKAMNPVKYLTSKVKFSVTNNEETPTVEDVPVDTPPAEPAPEPVEEPAPQGEELEASPVVDLTDFSTKKEEKEENPPLPNPTIKVENNAGDRLTVEVAQAEETAKGKVLTADDVLKTPINPKEPFTSYQYPTLNLLKKYADNDKPSVNMEEIKANNQRIVEVLNSFGVEIREIKATVGPTITLYEITPAEGVRINKIRNLGDDIALSLAALGVRIIAPIPGKGTIGIEVPNKKKNIVSMESILNSKKFQETKMDLPIALGKTITNEVFMVDLAKIPHLLVAGATGQGKSVGLNAIITSLLYKKHPNELKFVLIDPKKVEFSIYNQIADHFMAQVPSDDDDEEPIITDVTKVVRTLNSLCKLMDHRYDLLKKAGARNIKEYNEKFVNHRLKLTDGHDYMPYIVVIIDEFGDLIMTAGKEVELPIARIAQLARAVGIHMVIATQRPTTSIITGNIKANFPGRMAFRVSSMIDSRTILDRPGAEKLIGRGDMLFLSGSEPVRVQCAFVDTPEVEAINSYIAAQPGPVAPLELPEPDSNDGVSGSNGSTDVKNLDPYFEEAAHAIVISQQGSTSMIQRRFSIGYNRAGRLMDQLEAAGIVGAAQGSKPREVLITDENSLSALLAQLRG